MAVWLSMARKLAHDGDFAEITECHRLRIGGPATYDSPAIPKGSAFQQWHQEGNLADSAMVMTRRASH